MYRRLVVLSVIGGLCLITSTVLAQCGCGSVQTTYAPVVPSSTAYCTPTVANYPPAPYATCYTPATPQAAYYAPLAKPYATYVPVARPYSAYHGTAGWSIYGTPKVYVPGEPVRNVLRAVTP